MSKPKCSCWADNGSAQSTLKGSFLVVWKDTWTHCPVCGVGDTLDDIFTEKNVTDLTGKVLKNVSDEFLKKFKDEFYEEISCFLEDHYRLAKAGIKEKLVHEMADRFIRDPEDYKYRVLRDKLWEENKEKIIPILTDKAICECVERTLLKYTHINEHFSWKWREGIATMIVKHWDLFKDDENMQRVFDRAKQDEVDRLEEKITTIEEIHIYNMETAEVNDG